MYKMIKRFGSSLLLLGANCQYPNVYQNDYYNPMYVENYATPAQYAPEQYKCNCDLYPPMIDEPYVNPT